MISLSTRVAMLLAREPGLRAADLARVCKVSTASVADWQSGKTKSMKSEAARLAAAYFGCDQNWLSHGIGDPQWRDTPVAPPKQPSQPTLVEALPVVLDALARATARQELRQLLPMLIDTNAPAYKVRLAELLTAPRFTDGPLAGPDLTDQEREDARAFDKAIDRAASFNVTPEKHGIKST